jgi:hypothetical protein
MIERGLDLRSQRRLLRPRQKRDQKEQRSRSEADVCLSFIREVWNAAVLRDERVRGSLMLALIEC